MTREDFNRLCQSGTVLLDGATGSNLMKAGMPRGCCAEAWILEHPQALAELQRAYFEAGSQILYAPTFQAQPLALKKAGLDEKTEEVNAKLAALTRSAAPGALVAGDLTTLAADLDSYDEQYTDQMVALYRRQIRGLLDGGVDLLIAETLLYPLEAEAVCMAAELEGAGAVMYTFTMQPDGSLFSGREAGPVLRELEIAGAAAVGFNCVAAGADTPGLVSRLRRYVRGPLICKPNAGVPVVGPSGLAEYPMGPEEFAAIGADCQKMGAALLGGCCGTDPGYIRRLKEAIG